MSGKGVQLRRPEGSIPGDPGIELGESLRTEGVDPPLLFPTRIDQTAVPEDAQMPGDTRLARAGKGTTEIAGGPLAATQELEHLPTGRV